MDSDKEISKHSFKCGAFAIEPSRNLIILNDEKFSLEPRIMDVLCVLAEQPGEVMSREELIDRIWHVEFGADESLTRAISILRKTFRKAGSTDTYIETYPKRGYGLNQPVVRYADKPAEQIIEERERPTFANVDNSSPEESQTAAEVPAHSEPALSQPVADTRIERPVPQKRNMWLMVFGAIFVCAALFAFVSQSNKREIPITAQINERSLAVLPFEDYSPTKDQAYFADGIAEELLNVLSRIDGLRVASRTSSFAYEGGSMSAEKLGEVLGVDHILEGSVRKAGGTIRISAQLIDTKTDEHIWSQSYDRQLTAENIFKVQDDISRSIASELKIRMDVTNTVGNRPTQSTEAYEAYLRGKAMFAPRTKEAINASIDELLRAVALDPNFAAAHAALARVYMMAQEYGDMDPNKAYSNASLHLQTALSLAPNSSESLTAKARVLFQQRQFPIALEYFNVATVADPLDAEAWRGKGVSLREMGQLDGAFEALNRALDINPLSSMIYMNISNIELYRENIDAAIENVETALSLDSKNVAAHEQLSILTLLRGDYAGAHSLYRKNAETFPRIANHLQRLYYLIGRPDLETENMDWYNQAYSAFNAGDGDKAAEIAMNKTRTGPISQSVEILYNAGHLDPAFEMVKKDTVQLDIFKGPTEITAYDEQTAILYYKILAAKTDPLAASLHDKLAARFNDKTPRDFELPSSLWTGASWQLINEKPDDVLEWLDAMNERGQIWRHIEFDPLFDQLASSEAFETRWEKMEEIAADYSDIVDQQLESSNPE